MTKNCALKSQIQLKDKEMQTMKDRINELESACAKYEQNSENVAMMNATAQSRGSSQRFNVAATSISSKNSGPNTVGKKP